MTTTEAFDTGLRAEFEAWKRTKNDGYDAWDAVLWATERAAKIADEKAEHINSRWIALDIAAAIRASGGKGASDV
ncbi:hypothetical protein SAMN05518669_103429 [Variovorax sp. YR634]|uniref:hypothetical protein n=1 Tax=Variovorax sp. YR634 TaxID=1884385 RepID=UPI00089791D8|nr:hypothetical protein [Variovorax sp. YR634]SDX15890.1 hypothetical protein SAMN05518669_103429 [Variovorax sp. YR634]